MINPDPNYDLVDSTTINGTVVRAGDYVWCSAGGGDQLCEIKAIYSDDLLHLEYRAPEFNRTTVMSNEFHKKNDGVLMVSANGRSRFLTWRERVIYFIYDQLVRRFQWLIS